VTAWRGIVPAALLLVAGSAACGDDAELSEQVEDVASPSSLQDCADQLGFDPDGYEDFTDVTDLTDPDDFIAEFEDFSDEHPDEFDELLEEFNDEYADEFGEFTGTYNEEFEDVTGEATDVESTRELIIDTDSYTDLFVDFEGCAAFLQDRYAAEVLDQVDEPDEIEGNTGTGSGG
jgi:hypothetical protein